MLNVVAPLPEILPVDASRKASAGEPGEFVEDKVNVNV
jgi:hypothetical protein